jgi:hypothetical protein
VTAAANQFGIQLVYFDNDVVRGVDAIGRAIVRSIEQTEMDNQRRN